MAGNPLSDPNWAPKLTDKIDHYVGLVRDNATLKVVKIVRAIVFGLIAGIAALAALVVSLIILVRLTQRVSRAVFRVDHPGSVWISYLVIGALFMALGAFLMRLRHTSDS